MSFIVLYDIYEFLNLLNYIFQISCSSLSEMTTSQTNAIEHRYRINTFFVVTIP